MWLRLLFVGRTTTGLSDGLDRERAPRGDEMICSGRDTVPECHRSTKLNCVVLAVAMSVTALVPAHAQSGDASTAGQSNVLNRNSGRLMEEPRDGKQPIVGGWPERTPTSGASSPSPFGHNRMVGGSQTFAAAGTSTRQRSTRRKVIGGVAGAIVGFFGGGLLGGAIDRATCQRDCALAGLGGGVIGAPIGAVTGGILGTKYF